MPNYNQEIQQNNAELNDILKTANALPSSADFVKKNDLVPKDVNSQIIVTPGTNCTSVSVSYAKRTGNVVQFNLTAKTIARQLTAGSNVICNISFKNSELTPMLAVFDNTYLGTQIIGARLTANEINFRLTQTTSASMPITQSFMYICKG